MWVFSLFPFEVFVLLPCALIAAYVDWRTRSTIGRTACIASENRLTGAQVARRLLDAQGLYNVAIVQVPCDGTDDYDPQGKVLRLSSGIYGSVSVAAMTFAGFLAARAVQDKENYSYAILMPRCILLAKVLSWLAWLSLLAGIFVGPIFAILGCALLVVALALAFPVLVTQVDAGNRGMKLLAANGLISRAEYGAVRSVFDVFSIAVIGAALAATIQVLYTVRDNLSNG